jgi:hypothetical protein
MILSSLIALAVGAALLVATAPRGEKTQAFGIILAFGTPTLAAMWFAFLASSLGRWRLLAVLLGVPTLWLLAFVMSLSVAVSSGLLSL